MTDSPAKHRIATVILAAGMSTRFGANKMTVLVNDKPLVRRAITTANTAHSGRVYLVVGHAKDSVIEAAGEFDGEIVYNRDYRRGIGNSIAAGVSACRDNAEAVLLMLADQALVRESHLRALIASWSGGESEIVISAFDDAQGPPILFPSKCLHDLTQLDGDDGGKQILRNSAYSVKTVQCDAAGFDIDCQEDLQALTTS